MSRVSSGQEERSTSGVSSHTAEPSRSSPPRSRAGNQTPSTPSASKIAAWIWLFVAATVKKPMLRLTSAATKPAVEPAESVRQTSVRADDATPHEARFIALAVSGSHGPGQLGECAVEHQDVIGDGVGAGVARAPAAPTAPRRSRRRSKGSGENRNLPSCRWLQSVACSPSGSRPRRRRCRDRPGRSHWSSSLRPQICERTSATASASSDRSFGVISWKAR